MGPMAATGAPTFPPGGVFSATFLVTAPVISAPAISKVGTLAGPGANLTTFSVVAISVFSEPSAMRSSMVGVLARSGSLCGSVYVAVARR